MEMEFNKDYQSGIKKPIFGIINSIERYWNKFSINDCNNSIQLQKIPD